MSSEHVHHVLPGVDHPASPDGPRPPRLLIFDVNETLSDMSPMAKRFEDVGALSRPGDHLVRGAAAIGPRVAIRSRTGQRRP
ncbi:MAG: hypothetical protein M3419_02025 [Actinomycetota bacterium]|nr:hypothetical protein [Actinomycetota bacterium]MDQ3627598.1 hypothetical protein [Actinomycetota bacterium]